MGRIIMIDFWIICIMSALGTVNMANTCFELGNTVVGCPNEPGTGHPWIPGVRIEPLFKNTFMDADGNLVDMNDPDSFNRTLQNTVSYKPAPSGITDIFGFFSWVITGVRVLANIFIAPIFGLAQFVTNNFYVAAFVTSSFMGIFGMLQILSIYEFATGRTIF
jgi:hypothetical protein